MIVMIDVHVRLPISVQLTFALTLLSSMIQGFKCESLEFGLSMSPKLKFGCIVGIK